MFIKAVPATSLLFRAIRRALGVQDPPLVDASRLLPAPITASTWDRHRHVCPVCGQEMTKRLFKLDENDADYFCPPCDTLVAEEAHKQLETIRSRTGRLHLPTGTLNQMYRSVVAGTYARDMHRVQQQQALSEAEKNIIAALSTNRDLKQAPEVSQLVTLTQRHHTGPLPARDIEYAPTPRVPDVSQLITIHPNPATPTPETRESLFVDVPDTTHDEEEEADEEATEKRRIVRIARTTVQIPAVAAEVYLLEAMRRSSVHERNTGETEQVTAENWML